MPIVFISDGKLHHRIVPLERYLIHINAHASFHLKDDDFQLHHIFLRVAEYEYLSNPHPQAGLWANRSWHDDERI